MEDTVTEVVEDIISRFDEKQENELLLALELNKEERQQSKELSLGYYPEQQEWELIVRYSGDIEYLRFSYVENITYLLGNYAILRVKEENIEEVCRQPEILYVEKPKELQEQALRGMRVTNITGLKSWWRDRSGEELSGKEVLCGIVDSGIDIFHPLFRKENGDTKLLRLWDFGEGKMYTESDINRTLRENDTEKTEPVYGRDLSGHGTHVAGIVSQVAPEATILFVKLGKSGTLDLMRGVDVLVRTGLELGKPLVINLSYGFNNGSHDGGSLLETYLDYVSELGKNLICIGAGNEAGSGCHAGNVFEKNKGEVGEVELAVSEYETSIWVQLWKSFVDDFELELSLEGREGVYVVPKESGVYAVIIGETKISVLVGTPKPYSSAQEIYFLLQGQEGTGYVDSGVWRWRIIPRKIVVGRYDLWIAGGGVRGNNTSFLKPAKYTTLTIPGTAAKCLTVGAFDALTNQVAFFSGWGYTRIPERIKPELLAPGVEVVSAAVGGGYTAKSGTSMATPFVAGTGALLMEWGIILGNDPYMYGAKLKEYLCRETVGISGLKRPGEQQGYGGLYLAIPFEK